VSTPSQEPSRNPIRRVAARVSRWRNTRRGTSTLKAAYAQAARDAKRMDPTVRERIGRANMTKADLQQLSQANMAAAFQPGNQASANQLNDRAAAQLQAVGTSVPRTRNPIRNVANRVSRWRNTRQGTSTLKAAYAQAAKDVKRMDPAVREAIGQSRVTKADLQQLAQAHMVIAMRPEGRQGPAAAAAAQVQQQQQPQVQQPQAPGQAPAQAQQHNVQLGLQPVQGQAQGQQPAQAQPAQAQAPGQQPAQAQAQQQPAQAQAQGQQGASGRRTGPAHAAPSPTLGQRFSQARQRAASTASRWAKQVKTGTTTKATQIAAAYALRRQSPSARNAGQTPSAQAAQAWAAAAQQARAQAAPAQAAPAQTGTAQTGPAQVAPAGTAPAQAAPAQAAPAQATPAQAAPGQAAPAQAAPAQAAPGQAAPAQAGAGQAAPGQAAPAQSAPERTGPNANNPAWKAESAKLAHVALNNQAVPSATSVVEGFKQQQASGTDRGPGWVTNPNAPASGAVKASPATAQPDKHGEAAGTTHNKDRKPDGPAR
jgi:hypothetical protein